jgi:hypothetical protein
MKTFDVRKFASDYRKTLSEVTESDKTKGKLDESKKTKRKVTLSESKVTKKRALLEWVGKPKTEVEKSSYLETEGSIGKVVMDAIVSWVGQVKDGIRSLGRDVTGQRDGAVPSTIPDEWSCRRFNLELIIPVMGVDCKVHVGGGVDHVWSGDLWSMKIGGENEKKTCGNIYIDYEHPDIGYVSNGLYFDLFATPDEVIQQVSKSLGNPQPLPREDDFSELDVEIVDVPAPELDRPEVEDGDDGEEE